MREYECPTGAKLTINQSPFADAKALWQALMGELKDVEISAQSLLCLGFTSHAVEKALEKCLARCTYDGTTGADLKIDKDSFEPIKCRDDYVQVCIEVAMENVSPFMKSLYAAYRVYSAMTGSIQASRPQTTSS